MTKSNIKPEQKLLQKYTKRTVPLMYPFDVKGYSLGKMYKKLVYSLGKM